MLKMAFPLPFIGVSLLAFFSMVAALPSLGDAPAGALNAKDYGAIGDGKTDNVPALNRAIDEAIKHGPGTVLFIPAGTYCLGQRTLVAPEVKRGLELAITQANGLTVEGEPGTVLVCRNLMETIFSVEHSQNVTIRNLAVDADPLPYTQGVVTAYDPDTRNLEIQVDHGFDDIDRPDMQAMTLFRIYDNPYTNGWKENQYFPNLIDRVRLGPGHWRLTPTASVSAQQYHDFGPDLVGKKWMLWAKGYKGWVVHIGYSKDCLVENLQIYQAGGSGGFELVNDGDVTIRHDYIGPPPNSNRLFDGGGGAMSFFNRGTVIVEDCDFSQIDDDGFNLGTHFVRVVEKTDPRTCRTEVWPGDFQVGDTVALWDWQNKVERGEAKVTEADKEKDGHWTLHFDHPLDFGAVGEGNPNAPHKVQEADGIDRLTDLDSAGSCILRRNKISSMRARCFLVKTGHSVIEDNLFHDTHMPAILAGPEFFWGEAPQLRGLTIRNNTFKNIDAPNISIATFNSPTAIANKDVTIENNTFEDYGRFPVVYMPKDPPGVVIQVHNTDGVTIRGNHIAPAAPGCPNVDPIIVDKDTCRNVNISP